MGFFNKTLRSFISKSFVWGPVFSLGNDDDAADEAAYSVISMTQL
jgi:hypothetical protein